MAHNNESIDGIIQIKVKTMDSRTRDFRVNNQRRVRDLKREIARSIGMPIEHQRLIYCGRLLKDDQRISSYNIQDGDTVHLVHQVPSMSSNAGSSSRPGPSCSTRGADRISPGTQREISEAIEHLWLHHNLITQEYPVNGTGNNNTNVVLGNASNPSAPSRGIQTSEQVARLVSSTRDMLVNGISRFFLELEGNLRQNPNMGDPRIRQRVQENAERNRNLFDHLTAYFNGLGRVVMLAQTGANMDEGRSRRLQTALRMNDPVPVQLVQSMRNFMSDAGSQSLGQIISVDEMINPLQALASLHQGEQARTDISQRNSTGLTNEDGNPAPNFAIRRLRYTVYSLIPRASTTDQSQAGAPDVEEPHDHDSADEME